VSNPNVQRQEMARLLRRERELEAEAARLTGERDEAQGLVDHNRDRLLEQERVNAELTRKLDACTAERNGLWEQLVRKQKILDSLGLDAATLAGIEKGEGHADS
jgi:predicted  nucleic acid-binding Zn-ribbon protein